VDRALASGARGRRFKSCRARSSDPAGQPASDLGDLVDLARRHGDDELVRRVVVGVEDDVVPLRFVARANLWPIARGLGHPVEIELARWA
jgi:hypothetical protein